MDIPQLAADVAKFIAPFLPFLIAGTKAAAEEAGKQFGKAAWEKAVELWGKLKPKVEEKPAAQEAVEDVVKNQENEDAQAAFRRQLTKLFEADGALVNFISETITFENVVNTRGNVENAIVIAGNNNTAINVTNHIQGNVYNGPAPRNPQDALKVYRAVMTNMTSSLSMRGIDLRASDPNTQRAIGLANVYIDLDTTLSTTVKITEGKAREGVAGRIIRGFFPVLQLVIQNQRIVIKGDPGSGKSTFVNFITYCLSTQNTKRLLHWEKSDADVLPVIVVLRDFVKSFKKLPEQAEPRHLWDFIEKRLKSQNLSASSKPIQRLLEAGKVIVFLDGLDEVSATTQRVFMRDAVHTFVNRYPKNRFVVTCRVLSYTPPTVDGEQDLRLTGFPEFELAPFDDKKIENFIDAWYRELINLGVVTPEMANDLNTGLKSAVRSPELSKLAPNPLLLTVMAVVNTHKGRLPDVRALLYKETVEILLWQWEQASKGQDAARLRQLLLEADCSDADLEQVIWKLAYEAHAQTNYEDDEEPLAGISEINLQKSLAAINKGNLNWAADVIETMKMRAGLLLERDNNVFTFPHRSFQEFLAGTYLESMDDFVLRAKELADNQLLWRQVILWAVSRRVYIRGSLDGPLALIAELCPSRPLHDEKDWSKVWLAGDILLEVGLNRAERSELGRELLPRVQIRLVELLEGSHLTSRERAEAGNTLAKLGDTRPGVTSDFVFCAIPAGKFLMGSKKREMSSRGSEYPQIKYNIPYNYFMSRYPITNAQFDLFVKADGYKLEEYWDAAKNAGYWSKDGFKGRYDNEARNAPLSFTVPFNLPNHPVVGVSWYEAVAFCKWLTTKLRDTSYEIRCYDKEKGVYADDNLKLLIVNRKFEIRLPTEAEWERAARGYPLPEGEGRVRAFPWGDEITTDHANYRGTNINVTSAVGAFPLGMNDYGLLDMSGNVLEWCSTEWQENYEDYLKKENNSLEGNVVRVLRGGFYRYEGRNLRCAWRYGYDPFNLSDNFGFRVVVASFPISLLSSGF